MEPELIKDIAKLENNEIILKSDWQPNLKTNQGEVRGQRSEVRFSVKHPVTAWLVCKIHSEAQKLTMTGIQPVQVYGHTAQGASTAQVNAMCKNLKLGTVMGKTRACATGWIVSCLREPGAREHHPCGNDAQVVVRL